VWTGSWTGARRTPSAACAFVALARGIVAGQARVADECASHNLPVAGSSPARPTCGLIRFSARAADRCRWSGVPSGSWPADRSFNPLRGMKLAPA
jgi:hypothetical protein